MPFKQINVHEETYDRIKQMADEKGQKIAHCVAEQFDVEIDLITENKFYDMEVGEHWKARHDHEDIKLLNELRNKLGREYDIYGNNNFDFWNDGDPSKDQEAWIVTRTK